jgi:hypothetical protein
MTGWSGYIPESERHVETYDRKERNGPFGLSGQDAGYEPARQSGPTRHMNRNDM